VYIILTNRHGAARNNADFIDGTLFAANWKKLHPCSHHLFTFFPIPSLFLSLLRLAILCYGLYYHFSPSSFLPILFSCFFPAETIRAIARKHTVITAPRNWLIMRGWITARGRESFFFGRICCQHFYLIRFFKFPPVLLHRKPNDWVSSYRFISWFLFLLLNMSWA